MKLEIGKKYVSRNGRIVTIVKYDPTNIHGEHYYQFRGDNGYSYTEYGCFYISNRDNINDLVEEYIEKEYKQDENMNEKIDILIKYLMEDCDLVGKIKEVFEVMSS